MTSIPWPDPQRQSAFSQWFTAVSQARRLDQSSLHSASADASFRRYFRVQAQDSGDRAGPGSYIIMDAPPERENCAPFVHVAGILAQAGLNVPRVLEWDREGGFLLLSDLGQHTLMTALDAQRPHDSQPLFLQATDVLIQMQLASRPGDLPLFAAPQVLAEMELFSDWYLGRHRGVVLSATQRATLEQAYAVIAQRCLSVPQVVVHSDFMPRNLMLPRNGQPLGVLDFQDAVWGPITYDIASLMRDAFLSWEEDHVLDITIRYWEKARKSGLPVGDDFGEFYRSVEWTGLQRHLRIAGVFARLTLRDGKPQYLADAPRFIGYIRATCARYRELMPLLRLIDQVEGTQAVTGFAYGRV